MRPTTSLGVIPLSALAVLGVAGTALSVIAYLPHVVFAVRSAGPGGSWYGWSLSATAAAVWGSIGVLSGNPWLMLSSAITFPTATVLAGWSLRQHRRPRTVPLRIVAEPKPVSERVAA